MVNYREILRLHSLDYSQTQIASSVHSSRNTIRDVLKMASLRQIHWPLDEDVTNERLKGLLYPDSENTIIPRITPDYAYIHKELAKPGVNLSLLWTEYAADCTAKNITPYQYSWFCEQYRSWASLTKATMRIHHKPGDAMQVDWAGTTIQYSDPVTGEISDAYIFAAVLPCSCYAYVEATDDMKTTTWLMCHVHAYNYFQGSTRLLIPDNLKTGVIKNSRYETVLNKSYQEMAEHYGTAIIPARVKKPQDKSLAEGTVKFATTWIIAALRNQKFFSLSEVQAAVADKLEELNRHPFKKREGNRYIAFCNEEQMYMKPLPKNPYEPAVWSTAKVPLDYLIYDGKNKYSVPFDLIGETVDIRLTKNIVEVFFHNSRVASHPRSPYILRDPVTKPEHMPPEHRKYLTYNEEEFRRWASTVGAKTEKVINHFLTSGKEPEQGYKSCVSITKLADKYGCDRIEKACRRMLEFSSIPTVRNISTILKNGQDKLRSNSSDVKQATKSHGITRGASYFNKGGAHS